MNEKQLLEYIDRQATLLWGHYGLHYTACRNVIACNLMRGVAPTDGLWELCGKSIEERRVQFGFQVKPVPREMPED